MHCNHALTKKYQLVTCYKLASACDVTTNILTSLANLLVSSDSSTSAVKHFHDFEETENPELHNVSASTMTMHQ